MNIEPAPACALDARDDVIVGLLLAGGRGSRFDPSGQADKLMALWKAEPIAIHAARRLQTICHPCFAILGPDKPQLRQSLDTAGLITVVDPRVREGLGASLSVGMTTILERINPSAVAVMLADMPAIQASTLTHLADAWRNRPPGFAAAAPYLGTQRGHPVIFGRSVLRTLCELGGDRGAASVLGSVAVLRVDVDDPGILSDIDTPEDLKRIREAPDASA